MKNNADNFSKRYIKLYNEVHNDIISMFNEMTAGGEKCINNLAEHCVYVSVLGVHLITGLVYDEDTKSLRVVLSDRSVATYALNLYEIMLLHNAIEEEYNKLQK